MQNAFGDPQTIVLLGGTSDIGRATVRRLVRPSTATVVLARGTPTMHRILPPNCEVWALPASTAWPSTPARMPPTPRSSRAWPSATVTSMWCCWPSGYLGNPDDFVADPASAAPVLDVNYVGGVTVGLAVANRLRSQGHGADGDLLVSVAGERVRKANYVYGSTKAGWTASPKASATRWSGQRAPRYSSCGPGSSIRR